MHISLMFQIFFHPYCMYKKNVVIHLEILTGPPAGPGGPGSPSLPGVPREPVPPC